MGEQMSLAEALLHPRMGCNAKLAAMNAQVSWEPIAQLAARVRVPIVASGGAGSVAHLAEALDAGAAAVLAASIFHEERPGGPGVAGVKRELAALGFPMRLETTECEERTP